MWLFCMEAGKPHFGVGLFQVRLYCGVFGQAEARAGC